MICLNKLWNFRVECIYLFWKILGGMSSMVVQCYLRVVYLNEEWCENHVSYCKIIKVYLITVFFSYYLFLKAIFYFWD